jgi:hypothetical protein
MIRCDSNQRCEACPIEVLDDPKAKMMASHVVRSAESELTWNGTVLTDATLEDVADVVHEKIQLVGRPGLEGVAIGAIAILASEYCTT